MGLSETSKGLTTGCIVLDSSVMVLAIMWLWYVDGCTIVIWMHGMC